MRKRPIHLISFVFCLILISINQAQADDSKKPYDPNDFYHANVVARELNVFGFTWLGHVGMYDRRARKILEVLNEEGVPVISQINTLQSFKNKTTYWGMKYYVEMRKAPGISKPMLLAPTIKEREKVINLGIEQGKFNPKYAFTARYKVGRVEIEEKYNKRKGIWYKEERRYNGQFRCDTFVAWAYSAGVNSKKKNLFTFPMSPETLFADDNLKTFIVSEPEDEQP